MKKALAVGFLVILLCTLCACGGSADSSAKAHPIVGAWYLEEEDALVSFKSKGIVDVYWFERGTIADMETHSYSVEGDTVICEDMFEGPTKWSVSGKILKLDDSYSTCELERVSNITVKKENISGTWKKISEQATGGYGHFGCMTFDTPMGDISSYVKYFEFFKDNTYIAKTYWFDYDDYYSGTERYDEEKHGKYETVHNSQSILFDNSAYYDYQLLENGLMILDSRYIYAFQE